MLFRDIEVINAQEVPLEGPLIIYGNHNNQFIDGMLLIRTTPRTINFISAAKSMRRPVIGPLIRWSGAIPLERAQDVAKTGQGLVISLKGDVVTGRNTRFTAIQPGCSLELGDYGQFRVKAVKSDEQIIVANENKVEFEKDVKYKVIPKLQYSDLYKHVWEDLHRGGCIGIFPEGGSHDRADLLPLKAGICIMALGAMEKHNTAVTLLSCGFHYYQPEKFRSKVVMQYGHPYRVSQQLVQLYRTDKKKAISSLLTDLEQNLRMVTLCFNKQQGISALFTCRQLYALGSQLTEQQKMQLHRRFAKAFASLGEPKAENNKQQVKSEIIELYEKVNALDEYKKIHSLPISLHVERTSFVRDLVTLLFYLVKCINRCLFAIPGVIFMGPMTTLVAYLSEKERIKCLKASKVKVKGNDVVGSYKILVSLVLFPIFQVFNSIMTYVVLSNLTNWKPETVKKLAIAVLILVPLYALFMVRGLDSLGHAFKKLKYLFLKLFKRDSLDLYEKKVRELARHIRTAVDKYGKDVYNDFEEKRILKKGELVEIPPTPTVKKQKLF